MVPLRGERFNIRRIGVNDISVNRHLAEVGTIAPCGELCHLLVNEPFFFLRDIKVHLNAPLPVCHAPPSFLIRVWDIPASIVHFRARDLKIRKIASGYSLAVLAIETLPLFFPLLILQFGTEILAVRKRYIV